MEGDGTCVAQCGGSPGAPVCPKNGACTISGEGFLNLCFPTCDPLAQDCGVGEACYPISDDFYCAPDASGDMGEANDPDQQCVQWFDPVMLPEGDPLLDIGFCGVPL